MKAKLLHAATVLSIGLAVPAAAQDHSGHGEAAPAPAPAPAEPVDHSQMDHGQMNHGQMDHAQMDHSSMDEIEDPCAVVLCSSRVARPDTRVPVAVHAGHVPFASYVDASGTARLPGAEGMMPGLHFDIGSGWSGMAHGYAWGIYTDQGGPRGDDKLYVQSMAMLMAEKPFEWGRLQLKAMASAEPLMSNRGYPNLFATGETSDGEPLVDRQHPHDLFMELAGRVDVNIDDDTTAFLYGGPVGEPALGPAAFMHRASARLNPEAPITHHWFDSTHITYGVVTAGVANRLWQLEVSAFRGEEPDENRWDIEAPRFDSWSVRATLNPSPNWAMQASYGRLVEPEALHPGEDEGRTTASVHYNSGNGLAAMVAFSAKNRRPGPTLVAWLAEANWDLDEHHTLFGRFENVENDELFADHDDPLHDQAFRVSKLQAGYAYTLPVGETFGLSLGGTLATFFKPDALDGAYGDDPLGYTVFAKLTLGR